MARATMRAMVVSAPAPIDRRPLRLVDLPLPHPGTGEVLIKVEVCGVCRTALHVVRYSACRDYIRHDRSVLASGRAGRATLNAAIAVTVAYRISHLFEPPRLAPTPPTTKDTSRWNSR
jgi:hypothetical protein